MNNLKSNKNQMLSATTRKGRLLFEEKEIDGMIAALNVSYTKALKSAKKHENFAKSLLKDLEDIKIRDLS